MRASVARIRARVHVCQVSREVGARDATVVVRTMQLGRDHDAEETGHLVMVTC